MRTPFRPAAGALLALLLALGACTTERAAVVTPPDEQFGHRHEEALDGRETIRLAAPDSTTRYFYYPAVFDSLHVRPAADAALAEGPEGAVPVEVLVKGSFPDGCTELHALEQRRVGHIVEVDLQMRRPQGSVCVQVVRPYRFYFVLEGVYAPGPYTLKLNGTIQPFVVPEPVVPDASR